MIKFHKQIDLGLPSGTQWAAYNIGAYSPEDYGAYFAWGELYPSEEYTKENCETSGVEIVDFSGDWDYDIATDTWGEGWRMPTRGECEELVKECTWEWITQNGVNGHKVIGPNGNHIFIPAAGYRRPIFCGANECGFYWSSTPGDDGIVGDGVYCLYINSDYYSIGYDDRCDKQSVRLVKKQ